MLPSTFNVEARWNKYAAPDTAFHFPVSQSQERCGSGSEHNLKKEHCAVLHTQTSTTFSVLHPQTNGHLRHGHLDKYSYVSDALLHASLENFPDVSGPNSCPRFQPATSSSILQLRKALLKRMRLQVIYQFETFAVDQIRLACFSWLNPCALS